MNTDEIRAAVLRILQESGVLFHAAYVGETTRDEWKCDRWAVSFSNDKTREDFDFYTGLGLRKPDESPMAKASAFSLRKVSKRMLVWEEHRKRYPDKPQAPSPADVLYSLIRDAEGAEQSFSNWCADYGYSTDSRKAFATYEACQNEGDKLRRVFTRAQVPALSEALSEY